MTRSIPAAVLLLLAGACGAPDKPSAPGAETVVSNASQVKLERGETKQLGDSPEEAAKDIPKLLQGMNSPDGEVRWRSEFALGRVGPEGVKEITRALKSSDPKMRFAAAFVLGNLGRKASAAIPALIESSGDAEAGIRLWSVKSLGEIDAESGRVIPVIVKALRDTNPDIRRLALTIVIKLGPKATEAVPALTDLLQDADAGIRGRACIAFRQIGSEAKPALPALITRLADPDADVRDRAAQALSRIGPAGIPQLARALGERDANVRRAAAEILGSFGNDSRVAIPDLTAAAKNDDPAAKQAALDALKKIEGETGELALSSTTILEAPEAPLRRAAWYKWAKFGIFVHWGLYSVPARAKPGQLAEWVLENEKMPMKEYERFSLNFGAENFDATTWAKRANETGARYLVFTTKHHDGYCLWSTKLSDYNSLKFGAAKRDLVAELSRACEAEGVKFCAYYSLLDWHHPDYVGNFPKYVETMHAQVKELLTTYPIWGMWFDGEWAHSKDDWKGNELLAMVRTLKPQAFVNDRLGRETRGSISGVDFYTKEQEIPPAALKLQGRPVAWETSQTFGYSWGYCESPDPLKSGERVIEQLVDVVSKGGNFLLNVGARPDGSIPEAFVERMKVIGDWLKKNGDAIYDTERSPFPGPIPAGRVTSKGTRLYVFLEQLPKDGIIALPGLKTKVREAWMIDGKVELKVRAAGIEAPGELLPGPFTVVAIECEGPPEVVR